MFKFVLSYNQYHSDTLVGDALMDKININCGLSFFLLVGSSFSKRQPLGRLAIVIDVVQPAHWQHLLVAVLVWLAD